MLKLKNNIYIKPVFKNYRYIIPRSHSRVDPTIYLKTNMMADYIDKLSNDINMITIQEENDNDEHSCKYISYLNTIIILAVLLYMFWNNKK
jgi:hypothetical protein